jgi:hypothetical protein
MTSIVNWPAKAREKFTHETLVVGHSLHARPMFEDAGLASLLDRYPRDRLGVFTMGEDPVDWRSWQSGKAGDLSGAELLAGVHVGLIWLNLRATNHYLEDYEALSNELFADKEANIKGLKTLKHDLGVLISSPQCASLLSFGFSLGISLANSRHKVCPRLPTCTAFCAT